MAENLQVLKKKSAEYCRKSAGRAENLQSIAENLQLRLLCTFRGVSRASDVARPV